MTLQEFKVAFKLITGKNVERHTIFSCNYNMVILFFDLIEESAIIQYFERGLINLVNAKQQSMSYEDILDTMKK